MNAHKCSYRTGKINIVTDMTMAIFKDTIKNCSGTVGCEWAR